MPIYAWVQDPPTITTALAQVALQGNADTRAATTAPATVALDAEFPAATTADAAATVTLITPAQARPRLSASATLEFEGSASTIGGLFAAVAPATMPIQAPAAVTLELFAPEVVRVIGEFRSATAHQGDASIAFEDLGQGSDPIFPFRLPILFFGTARNEITATATLELDGAGTIDAVAAQALAAITIDAPAQASSPGQAPVFPFRLPAVFTDATAGIQSAAADVLIDGDGEGSAAVDADAAIVILGAALTTANAVFPFTLPARLGA